MSSFPTLLPSLTAPRGSSSWMGCWVLSTGAATGHPVRHGSKKIRPEVRTFLLLRDHQAVVLGGTRFSLPSGALGSHANNWKSCTMTPFRKKEASFPCSKPLSLGISHLCVIISGHILKPVPDSTISQQRVRFDTGFHLPADSAKLCDNHQARNNHSPASSGASPGGRWSTHEDRAFSAWKAERPQRTLSCRAPRTKAHGREQYLRVGDSRSDGTVSDK